jgi:hypothetical protein
VSGDDRQRARLSRLCGPGRDPGEVRVDDAGGVDPHEHLAFPGTGLRRLLVGERLGATPGALTDIAFIVPPPCTVGRTNQAERARLGRQRAGRRSFSSRLLGGTLRYLFIAPQIVYVLTYAIQVGK